MRSDPSALGSITILRKHERQAARPPSSFLSPATMATGFTVGCSANRLPSSACGSPWGTDHPIITTDSKDQTSFRPGHAEVRILPPQPQNFPWTLCGYECGLSRGFTIEFFRTRPSDEAHATLERISIVADNHAAATVKAKSLFDTLDMPQKPDGLRILDQVKRELFVWVPDAHDA
jgi:hypothetical protein